MTKSQDFLNIGWA